MIIDQNSTSKCMYADMQIKNVFIRMLHVFIISFRFGSSQNWTHINDLWCYFGTTNCKFFLYSFPLRTNSWKSISRQWPNSATRSKNGYKRRICRLNWMVLVPKTSVGRHSWWPLSRNRGCFTTHRATYATQRD